MRIFVISEALNSVCDAAASSLLSPFSWKSGSSTWSELRVEPDRHGAHVKNRADGYMRAALSL